MLKSCLWLFWRQKYNWSGVYCFSACSTANSRLSHLVETCFTICWYSVLQKLQKWANSLCAFVKPIVQVHHIFHIKISDRFRLVIVTLKLLMHAYFTATMFTIIVWLSFIMCYVSSCSIAISSISCNWLVWMVYSSFSASSGISVALADMCILFIWREI